METSVSLQNLWRSSLKTISESEIALGLFIETLKQFFTSRPEKNTLVHNLHLFLSKLFCLEREDIQMEIQCLLTLCNPQDRSVKIRRLIQSPSIKATILSSRRELQAITYKLNEDFRSILTPRRTPTLYKKTSLVGLGVDIYGDEKSRGKKDVVRILQSGIKLSNHQPMSSRLLCLR